MSEHITRLAERLQQQVGESHNKPTVKQFEEMLTDALGAEHLTASKALFETLKTVHEAALDALEEDVQ